MYRTYSLDENRISVRVEKTVYISYRRANAPWALALYHALTSHGFDVFMDYQGLASGDFEQAILENIQSRAHFIVVLTPSSLEQCHQPGDWFRREIETAMDCLRNIVPVMLDNFDFNAPDIDEKLTGKLVALKEYNGLNVSAEFFDAAMVKLREQFLDIELDAVLQPASKTARDTVIAQQAAANAAPAVTIAELIAKDPLPKPSHQRWHPLVAGYPPAWATGWGEDDYGVFVDVKLNGSRFRFRWIPPGQFFIGSPKTEPGRYDDESAGAQISFSKGYWLMDTPVTQGLWQVVMGENPSRFQSSDRPVEQVSWNDVQDFLLKMNNRVEGLSLRLPSESEWEYACRGGTEEATYAGAIDIKGERNAPVLDAIAWYGGNSGIDFELEEGHESSEWPEKQYEHSKAGTHPVGKKNPNRWGCYDLLGNVWEWCEDVWSESHEGIDIRGAPRIGSSDERGEARVVRGGSWNYGARGVRAACRGWFGPGTRGDNLGFRCVLGQSSAVARDERLLSAGVAEPRPVLENIEKRLKV